MSATSPTTTSQYPQKPGMVTAIAIMTLINGIFNTIWGFVLSGIVIISTVGFGIFCAPLTILPTVLGIFEIIYATKILPNPIQPVKPNQTLAILEIVDILFGAITSAVIGVLALVFYNDPQVKAYFAYINGQPIPAAPAQPAPPVIAPQPTPPALPKIQAAEKAEPVAKPKKAAPKKTTTKKSGSSSS